MGESTMVWWEALLAYVGGPAVALGAFGYLVKYLLDKSFERDKEKRAEDVEQFRHELQLERQTRDAQVRGIYQNQLEGAQAIYVQWVETRSWLVTLINPGGRASKHREYANKLDENLHKLWLVITRNRLVLPKNLVIQIDDAFKELEQLIFDARFSQNEMESEGKTAFDSKDFRNVRRVLRPKLDKVEALLEYHCRILLGVDAGEEPPGLSEQ